MAQSRRRALAVAVLALWACGRETGPEPVVWNKTACARCRMLVGEPEFAAQLHPSRGPVLHFDDPGCLLLHADEHPELDFEAGWFHHVSEDRWLLGAEVAFVEVDRPTPMGYGLGAVGRGEVPEAFDRAEALARVRRREAARAPAR